MMVKIFVILIIFSIIFVFSVYADHTTVNATILIVQSFESTANVYNPNNIPNENSLINHYNVNNYYELAQCYIMSNIQTSNICISTNLKTQLTFFNFNPTDMNPYCGIVNLHSIGMSMPYTGILYVVYNNSKISMNSFITFNIYSFNNF